MMDEQHTLKIAVLYDFMLELFRFPSIKLLDAAVTYQNLFENNQLHKTQQLNQFIAFLFDCQPSIIEEKYFGSPHTQIIPSLMLLATEHEIRFSLLGEAEQKKCNPFNFDSFQAYLLDKKKHLHQYNAYYIRDFVIPVLYQIKDCFVSEYRPVKNIKPFSKHLQRFEQHTTNPFQHAFLALHESFKNLTRPQAPFSEIPEAFTINPLAISKRNDKAFFPGWISLN